MSDTTTLVQRLRALADEVESAERYGVPIPYSFTVSGHEFSGASFSAVHGEFDAWVDYADATVEEYDYNGSHWRSATADVNGLPVSFAVREVTA